MVEISGAASTNAGALGWGLLVAETLTEYRVYCVSLLCRGSGLGHLRVQAMQHVLWVSWLF